MIRAVRTRFAIVDPLGLIWPKPRSTALPRRASASSGGGTEPSGLTLASRGGSIVERNRHEDNLRLRAAARSSASCPCRLCQQPAGWQPRRHLVEQRGPDRNG